MTLIVDYRGLLLTQFFNKTRARAEIELQADQWEQIRLVLIAFKDSLDLDGPAVGDQLDKIGKIIGLSRIRSEVVPVSMQGDTASQLNDDSYLQLIVLKIAINTSLPVMVNADGRSIQDLVRLALGNDVYVVDKQTMRLLLMIPPGFDLVLLQFIFDANLLPKPTAVQYVVQQQAALGMFGFTRNVNTEGFAFAVGTGSEVTGGPFARRLSF